MKVEITEGTIEESIYLYSDQEMQYWDLEPPFVLYCGIEQELKDIPDTPMTNVVGFYYDEPELLVNPNKARSSLGLMIDPKNKTHVDVVKRLLNERNATYHEVRLPQIKVLKTEFPFRNWFSIYVALWKCMGPLYDKFMQEYPHLFEESLGIEIYQETKLVYTTPIDDKKRKNYLLSPFPKPEYKNKTTL